MNHHKQKISEQLDDAYARFQQHRDTAEATNWRLKYESLLRAYADTVRNERQLSLVL